MLQEEPLVYRITKVKNTTPKGIINFTVKQDRYEPEHDYVSLDPNADDYGDMYADFYSSDVYPKKEKLNTGYHLVIESKNNNVKIGSFKVLEAQIYDAKNNKVTDEYSGCNWNLEFMPGNSGLDKNSNVIEIDNDYTNNNKYKIKFKFTGDEKYLNTFVKATCTIEDLSTSTLLDVVSL